jgi:hypothetical protein
MIPTVDNERLSSTYDELKRMIVKLDPNPIMYGPTRFNNRIAQVRSMLSRVEQIFLQVSEDLHWYKRVTRAKKMLYELERRDLMVNDPKCRMGRSQSEREALADVQLRSQIEEIEDLSAKAEDLEILLFAIKSKRSDLKDIQGRMRDQMKMIDQDLSMGARWGRKDPPSLAADSSSNDHIDSLLSTIDESVESEETEDSPEDGEEVLVTDDHHDPSPSSHDLPTGVFEEPVDQIESSFEDLIPFEDSEGNLPKDEHAADEADSFLEDLDLDLDTPQEKAPSNIGGSIEDLISSLIDD